MTTKYTAFEYLKMGSLLLTPLVSVIFFFGVLQSSIEMNEYRLSQHDKAIARLEIVTDNIKKDLAIIKKDIAVISNDIKAIRDSMEERSSE